ncbi:unnamed protein product [Gadus morhua 'NCC']
MHVLMLPSHVHVLTLPSQVHVLTNPSHVHTDGGLTNRTGRWKAGIHVHTPRAHISCTPLVHAPPPPQVCEAVAAEQRRLQRRRRCHPSHRPRRGAARTSPQHQNTAVAMTIARENQEATGGRRRTNSHSRETDGQQLVSARRNARSNREDGSGERRRAAERSSRERRRAAERSGMRSSRRRSPRGQPWGGAGMRQREA